MTTLVRHLTRRSPASLRAFHTFKSQGSNICQKNALTRSVPVLASCSQRSFVTRTYSTASNEQHSAQPAQLSQNEYHKHSDAYIDSVVEALEEMAESNPAMDVEYHASREFLLRGQNMSNFHSQECSTLCFPLLEPMLSISSRRTSRYGSALRFQDLNDTTLLETEMAKDYGCI